MLINHLLFPISVENEVFEQYDMNDFSNSHVDVFFEKCFKIKRNIVVMDGEGKIKDEAIKKIINLTNLFVINFHRLDIEEKLQVENL